MSGDESREIYGRLNMSDQIDGAGYVVTDFSGELVQTLDVDVFLGAGCIIRPGDRIVLSTDRALTIADGEEIRNELLGLLPGVVDVVVLAAGLRISGVHRDAHDKDEDFA